MKREVLGWGSCQLNPVEKLWDSRLVYLERPLGEFKTSRHLRLAAEETRVWPGA